MPSSGVYIGGWRITGHGYVAIDVLPRIPKVCGCMVKVWQAWDNQYTRDGVSIWDLLGKTSDSAYHTKRSDLERIYVSTRYNKLSQY